MCRRELKVNASKSKLMVLNGEEGLECEVHVNCIHLEHVSDFNYLGCVLDEKGTDEAEAIGRCCVCRCYQVPGNARDLQHECARVLHETLLVPILMYGSETMLWKEKERSRIRAVQIDNLKIARY